MAKQITAINLFPVGSVIDSSTIVALNQCKFRPRLKAGMTRREANDAIDAGLQQFVTCLKNKGKKAVPS